MEISIGYDADAANVAENYSLHRQNVDICQDFH